MGQIQLVYAILLVMDSHMHTHGMPCHAWSLIAHNLNCINLDVHEQVVAYVGCGVMNGGASGGVGCARGNSWGGQGGPCPPPPPPTFNTLTVTISEVHIFKVSTVKAPQHQLSPWPFCIRKVTSPPNFQMEITPLLWCNEWGSKEGNLFVHQRSLLPAFRKNLRICPHY